jgi:DnaJ-class molecular chaperone
MECPNCNGTGEGYDGEECCVCNGAGYFYEQD